MLSKEIHELIAKRDKLETEYRKVINQLSDAMMQETDELVSVCKHQAVTYTQLFIQDHDDMTITKQEDLLKSLADDGAISKTYEDDDCIHYDFNIDRSRFCCVVTK